MNLTVTFLGTGSAMPAPDRVQTGLLLERGDRRLLVDCGAGVLHRLSQTDAGVEGVSTVLLTHHHLDHVNDLLALLQARWLAGETHLEVVGPPGTKGLIDDLLEAFAFLQDRVDLAVREVAAGGGPFDVADFEVRATETVHSMPGLAYRFAGVDGGGDFTFSGDSEAHPPLAEFADGSSVLAHDCSFPDEVNVENHPTATQLGEVLAGRDVDRLYCTHLYPHTDGKHEAMRASIRDAGFEGEVRFARDGLRVEI